MTPRNRYFPLRLACDRNATHRNAPHRNATQLEPFFNLGVMRDRHQLQQSHGTAMLFFAMLIALSGFLPYPPLPAMGLMVICLIVRLRHPVAFLYQP